jgi:hypothetical protein
MSFFSPVFKITINLVKVIRYLQTSIISFRNRLVSNKPQYKAVPNNELKKLIERPTY